MAKDTKTKILDAALEIFARDGYEGTNIKDIAESVGIVKSALYRHFASKEEIMKGVCEMMEQYYQEHFGSVEALPSIPKTTDELYEMTRKMVEFTVHDKKDREIRRILFAEQFHDEKIRDLASKHFLYDTRDIFTKVFEKMIKKGTIKKADPEILAFSYTAPIASLVHLCDREPEKEEETMKTLKKFVKQFVDAYGAKKK